MTVLTRLWLWLLHKYAPSNGVRDDESSIDNGAADDDANQSILWEDESPDTGT